MQVATLMMAAAIATVGGSASADPALPARASLGSIPLSAAKLVSRVETTRVDFLPGQAMPTHKHTVPVICFVTRGAFLVSIGDEPERRAAPGSVTFEPPEVIVHYFKNASATDPAQLECASLSGDDDHVLNIMLPR